MYQMENKATYSKTYNSKGGHILKKMLEDKQAIFAHFRKGGTIEEIKHLYNFVAPI
jgi:hypothetical protein